MIDYVKTYRGPVLLLLLLVIVYFPIFLHLDFMPIRQWDESIVGINAIEMSHNHNYVVTYFNGSPEMSNTKPPLTIWCIVFFIKILGFSELSLRLPSALAAVALCSFMFFALHKITGGWSFGFFAVCILVTSQGFIHNHVTRTGEYDSMLVLFSTMASIYLFIATEALEKKEQSKYLFLFFVIMTLAVLTKGVAYLMQVPGLFLYVLIRKKLMAFVKDRAFYAGLAFFIVFGLGYYFLRESVNPGYLKAVWLNELGGRYASHQGHEGPFSFYLTQIITTQFVNYYWLLPASIIAGLWFNENRVQRLAAFALVTGSFFLVIISMAGTMLPHYDAPLFPYLAILTASLFYGLYNTLRKWGNPDNQILARNSAAFIIIISLLAKPYADIIATVYFPKGDPWEEGFSSYCKYFQAVVRNELKLKANKLIFNASELQHGPTSVLYCYKEELNERGKQLEIANAGQVKLNDTILFSDDWWIRHELEQKYTLQTIQHLPEYNVDFAKVIPIKTEESLAP